MKTKPYSVLQDGFINGVWAKSGDQLHLTEAQAAMFIDRGRIEPARPPEEKTVRKA